MRPIWHSPPIQISPLEAFAIAKVDLLPVTADDVEALGPMGAKMNLKMRDGLPFKLKPKGRVLFYELP
jgi:hypothetical protein